MPRPGLQRATTPHRPPQAFIAAAIIWLLVTVGVGAAVLAGRPLALAYGFLLLIGWIGQIVNTHTLHLGTHVIAIAYRGDEDETRPRDLLDMRLSWTSFGLFQAAVALAAWGLAYDLPRTSDVRCPCRHRSMGRHDARLGTCASPRAILTGP